MSGAALQVLAGGGIAGPMRELAVMAERTLGRPWIMRFGTTPQLVALATTGGPFDLGVTPRDVHENAAGRARFENVPTIDIARVGLGVAVPAGAPKPDISTPEALRSALLAAKSVAGIPASAGGTRMLQVFDELGIGEAMRAKLVAAAGPGPLVQTLAAGEAELGVFLANVLVAPGLDLVGPFPAALQQEVVFTAAVAVDTPNAAAAREAIAFLRSPAAVEVFRRMAMTPG